MTTLAIDIGGTKIAAAVCDENDSIIQRWRVPTPMDADAINQHIAEVYREAVAAGHTDIEAIGISAAGKYVDLLAEMDVVILVSNCAQLNNPCNDYNPTPVEMIIWEKQE